MMRCSLSINYSVQNPYVSAIAQIQVAQVSSQCVLSLSMTMDTIPEVTAASSTSEYVENENNKEVNNEMIVDSKIPSDLEVLTDLGEGILPFLVS